MHLCPKDLSMKVNQAGHRAHQDPQGLGLRQCHPDKVHRQNWMIRKYSPVEVVIEAAKGVVVCDQPELGAAVPRGAV